MQSVFTIAEAFIRLGIKNNNPLTHLQVQKLCFLAQGFYLAAFNKSLFEQEIKAWPYGPVIPSLYTKLKRFGREKIKDKNPLQAPELLDSMAYELVEIIYDNYGDWTGGQLSNLTHERNTPWDKVWSHERFSTIPQDLIKEFYKEKFNV